MHLLYHREKRSDAAISNPALCSIEIASALLRNDNNYLLSRFAVCKNRSGGKAPQALTLSRGQGF